MTSENQKYIIPFGNSESFQSLEVYFNSLKNNQADLPPFKEFVIKQSKLDLNNCLYRKVIVAEDWNEFFEKLENNKHHGQSQSHIQSQSQSLNGKKVVMVISGQGYQTPEMGLQLYQSDPYYKEVVDKLDVAFQQFTGFSILEKLKSIPSDKREIFFDQTIGQPSLLMFQIGVIELYKHFGINPEIALGQSFGEITAAYVAGCIPLETAVKIIYHRSIIKGGDPSEGKMMLVKMSHVEYVEKYSQAFPTIEIICYSTPNLFFVSGDPDLVDQLKVILEKEHIGSIDSLLPGSFHSRKQKVLKPKVFETLSPMDDAKPPAIKWYSTVTGDLYTDVFSPKYVYDNLRRPVKFEQALKSLERDIGESFDDHVFLEIAPRPVYHKHVKANIEQFETMICPTHPGTQERESFLESLGELFCSGVKVDFSKQFTNN